MSDFLFTRTVGCSQQLKAQVVKCTRVDNFEMDCFEGEWGSLAVSKNRHAGYQPYENKRGITVVIGGPLGNFTQFEGEGINSDNFATAFVSQRLFQDRLLKWEDELLGPFCILNIDKITGKVTVLTDCMSFIPVYKYGEPQSSTGADWMLSTHLDAAALAHWEINNVQPELDPVSICDLILNRRITFPYTFYTNGRELTPATYHYFEKSGNHERVAYWRPMEEPDHYGSLREAATEVRESLEEIIRCHASSHNELALLLSAGEDSRLLACMIPRETTLRCYTVAPQENRESEIAHKVSTQLRSPWQFIPLPPSSYLQDFPRSALFAGSCGHGRGAHFTNLMRETPLAKEHVVLGGFKSDTFLKGHYISSRNQIPGIGFHYRTRPVQDNKDTKSGLFPDAIEDAVYERRLKHLQRVAEMRPLTANEWHKFWPMSQDHDIVYYWSNRRLFSICEVFMTRRIAAVAARVPDQWLLNRRLFQMAAQPYLRRLQWMVHGEGHFPALPWYFNIFLCPIVRAKRRFFSSIRQGPQGAWPSLDSQLKSRETLDVLERLLPVSDQIGTSAERVRSVYMSKECGEVTRYGILQVLAVVDEISNSGKLWRGGTD